MRGLLDPVALLRDVDDRRDDAALSGRRERNAGRDGSVTDVEGLGPLLAVAGRREPLLDGIPGELFREGDRPRGRTVRAGPGLGGDPVRSVVPSGASRNVGPGMC